LKNITFTILNNKNQIITLKCILHDDDNKLYRAGMPVCCDCQGTTNPTPYLFLNDDVYCPRCGKKSLSIIFEDEDNQVKLNYIGTDYNTMQKLYKLSETLPYNVWLSIADYFVKLTPDDVSLDYPLDYVGWVTSNPDVVEDVLGVTTDLKVCNRDVEKELEESLNTNNNLIGECKSIDETELYSIIDDLHAVFSVVETPYGRFELDGEIFENPLHPPSEYGRGEYWIVCDERIWFVRYNFRSGDNLKANNVIVDGGLKAIGKCIGFDENVYELLLKI